MGAISVGIVCLYTYNEGKDEKEAGIEIIVYFFTDILDFSCFMLSRLDHLMLNDKNARLLCCLPHSTLYMKNASRICLFALQDKFAPLHIITM